MSSYSLIGHGIFLHKCKGDAAMNNNLITVINPTQAGRYMKHGCLPVKVTWENDKMIFYFDKKASYPLFIKWIKYELD